MSKVDAVKCDRCGQVFILPCPEGNQDALPQKVAMLADKELCGKCRIQFAGFLVGIDDLRDIEEIKRFIEDKEVARRVGTPTGQG